MKRKDDMSDEQLQNLMKESENKLIEVSSPLYSEEIYTKAIEIVNNLLPKGINLNEEGVKDFRHLIDLYGVEKYLKTAEACQPYLVPKYSAEPGEYEINAFISQFYKRIKYIHDSEITKREAYVFGIAKHKFGTWSIKTVALIIKNLNITFKELGYEEDDILDYYDNTLIPYMKNCKNWTTFKTALNKYIH